MPSPDEFSMAFHIGAHKTATSHLQRSLSDASDSLADVGVQYYGPADFRLPGRAIQRLFGLTPSAAQKLRRTPQDQLALLRKGAHRLVISEENYVGVLNSPRRREVKMRYPHAAQRITDLATAMDIGGIDIFLSIRNPTSYLNSAYGQQLLGGRIMTMVQYMNINPLSSVDWAAWVKGLRQAKGVNALTVWCYEDYQTLFPQICTAMVGQAEGELVSPLPRRIHVGLSGRAVADVLAKKGAGDGDRPAHWARKHFPVNAANAAFDGFTAQEHATADRMYGDQIAAIRALPNVTFLKP